MAATIHDVARKACVSVGTVSRYLNGHELKEKNRQAVEQAIEELGFKENMIAKGLKNNRTMTIGVVIGSLTDIFSTSIVSAFERCVEKHNYSIIVCDYDGDENRFRSKVDFLKERSVDGLVIFPGHRFAETLKNCIGRDIPAVVVNDDFSGVEADKVIVDNSNASFRAIERFINMKHRRISVINGPEDSYVSRERFKGYLEALSVYGIPVDDKYVKYGNFSSVGGYEAVKSLFSLSDPPTALFIANYYMTLGAVMAINELGIQVPEQLSVIGFDRFDFMDAVHPALTVIEQPSDVMGEAVADVILRRMRKDYSDFPSVIEVNTRFYVKDSVAEPADIRQSKLII